MSTGPTPPPTTPGEAPAVRRVTVVGVGRMGSAIASAVSRATDLAVGEVVGCEPDADVATRVADELGIRVETDPSAAVAGAEVVVVAVKPHLVSDVLTAIADHLDDDAVVVSVAAGVTTTAMEAALAPGTRAVRVMPNTPMLVGQAMSVLTGGTHAEAHDVDRVAALLAEAGDVRILPEEQFDAVTGVSGSGPAYVFALAEAMVAGAEAVGLAHDDAVVLVEQTIAGAGALLAASPQSAAELREMVSSPGGTTLAGLARLDDHGLQAAVVDAIEAATARSRELGKD
ncbi:pyrroline-5-carboxylate reductase [Salsipaludibacter albus]|uniref:pyrroline-5-carboxylate reductase n=1 Tax=Salsipaludibacter albus TaxID=2849650 RepID=UPI001EE3AD30|nr:pyrroline-5-carboxylate reductase [Salsipaludibacter albus]MBY5161106.1 pyrroline-5-carboxylate reductase [Salsipaludibacter albus]